MMFGLKRPTISWSGGMGNNMESKIAYLGFIQEVIKRMASNSFLLKGWSVTLISALFALSAKDANENYVIISYFPALLFWLLDAFYLHQEKLFRELYKVASYEDSALPIFSMDTSSVRTTVDSYSKVALSKTIFPFHAILVGTIVVVMYVIKT